jgi:hypothetical protein
MIQEEHARIAGLCLKRARSSVLVCTYFEADDEDKKIYVKATEKNYKTSTMTINLITKRM